MNAAQPPTRLIVTVDTEEEGLWSGQYRREGNTTANLRALPRFQTLCERYDIRPTYLIDAAVVSDPWATEQLAGWQNAELCEVGAHCHPWCNPPFEETVNSRNSFLCNLPEDLQRRKLTWLTEAVEQRLGRRPTSFRAGRYGLDGRTARLLADLGYRVDSSVVPFTDYSAGGGPDFDGAPLEPYWIGDDLKRPAAAGTIREVPLSVGYSRRNFEAAHVLRRRASQAVWNRFHVVGLLDRCGVARRIKLSPEQASPRDLIQLTDCLLARGISTLVLMFHSSSLMAGGSPYVRDATDVERFFTKLERFFLACRDGRHLGTARLSDAVSDRVFQEASTERDSLSSEPAMDGHLFDAAGVEGVARPLALRDVCSSVTNDSVRSYFLPR